MEEPLTKRYVVHDFLIGDPVLIDRLENTMSLYKHNIYGQIYNLNNPDSYALDTKKVNGLIRRTQNPCYNFGNAKAVDGYIYKYIMTPEQQGKCYKKPSIPKHSELIIATDNKDDAIRAMCNYVFEHGFVGHFGGKGDPAERDKYLKYCDDFLAGKDPKQSIHVASKAPTSLTASTAPTAEIEFSPTGSHSKTTQQRGR